MKIYKLDFVVVHRDWSLFEPTEQMAAALIPEFWDNEIWRFVNDWFYGVPFKYGFTREWVHLFMVKHFIINTAVRGFSGDVGLVAAKAEFMHLVALKAAATGWFAVGLLAGLAMLGLFFAITDWNPALDGMLIFPPGSCIMRYEERLWWAGVVAHPADRVWIYRRCYEIGELSFLERLGYPHRPVRFDDWRFAYAWQSKEQMVGFWYVYSFDYMRIYYLGVGHRIDDTHYRIVQPWGYGAPVGVLPGWSRSDLEACAFTMKWNDIFRPEFG